MKRQLRIVSCAAAIVMLSSASTAQSPAVPPAAPPPASPDVERMVQSTVQVYCRDAWGSGVVVADVNTVVTNYHVLNACGATAPGATIGIRAYNGAEAKARVIRGFPDVDLGVLRIAGILPVVVSSLRSDATLKQMQTVVAVGYPGIGELGVVGDELARTSVGTVARPSRQDARAPRWVIEHGAPIFPGNSGGPLFDECGTVVGLNTFVTIESSGAGSIPFAIGARTIEERAASVLSSPIDYLQTACGSTIAQKAAILTEQAKKSGDDSLVKVVSGAMARFSRWEKDYEKKSAARDSAVGELTNFLQSQINDMRPELARSAGIVAQQGKSIAALQSEWTSMETNWQKEAQRIWIGVSLAGLTALASLGLFVVLRRRVIHAEAGVAAIEGRVEHLEFRLARGVPGMLQRASRVFLGAKPTRALDDGNKSNSATTGPRAVLTICDASGMRHFTLGAGESALLGREPASDGDGSEKLIAIAEQAPDGAVSRTHLRIEFDGAKLWVTDLGSANGSKLQANGSSLPSHKRMLLLENARIALARDQYTVGAEVDRSERTRRLSTAV